MFWPEEECYSEVPESKVVAEPNSPNGMIKVKERSKVYTGQVIAVGSKADIQQKLNTLLAERQEQPGQPTTATEPPQTTEPLQATHLAESRPETSQGQGT